MKGLSFFISWLDSHPFRLYLLVFLLFAVVRLGMLPWNGIGLADDHDELSYLLQAETFAMGRLTNPSPPHWQHFESFHILQQPSYASKYPPGQAFFLFLGIKFFGHPWFGVLLSCMLMTACIVWMIRGYLGTGWALLAGIITILQFAVWNYWSSSYWGGAVAAIGGALFFGALPRFKSTETRTLVTSSICFGLGLVILSQSRPLEGLILGAIPMVYFTKILCGKIKSQQTRSSALLLIPALVLLISGLCFSLYYNYHVTGNPYSPPYQLHHEQYGLQAPVYVLDNKAEIPVYNHSLFARYYQQWELVPVDSLTTFVQLKFEHLKKFISFFYFWPVLLALGLGFIYADRFKIPCWSFILFACSFLVYPWFHPHYFAPALAIYYLLLLIGVRYLVRHKNRYLRTSACVLLPAMLLLTTINSNYFSVQYPGYINGDQDYIRVKEKITNQLQQSDQKHLVLISYDHDHPFHEEWVYNGPDLDSSQVIWARSMSPEKNRQLRKYYSDRKVWMLQPDKDDVQLEIFNQ